jgi:anti-sigma28 factor (negative regulator of flagellin synthesis)
MTKYASYNLQLVTYLSKNASIIRNGRYEMGDTKWAIRNGRYKMGDSKWAIRNGRYEMGDTR